MRASALAGGTIITARRSRVLTDWRTDSSQKSPAFHWPFDGSVLFGSQLEDKLLKLSWEKRSSSSVSQSFLHLDLHRY